MQCVNFANELCHCRFYCASSQFENFTPRENTYTDITETQTKFIVQKIIF